MAFSDVLKHLDERRTYESSLLALLGVLASQRDQLARLTTQTRPIEGDPR
jgi:hypothetical protein